MARARVPGRAGSTNINMDIERKLTWREKMHRQLAEAEQRNPHRMTPRPIVQVRQKPVMADLGNIPMPMDTNDLFDMLPTMTVARQATLERMKMNKIMTMEDEYFLGKEAQEFDEEVRGDMNDAFGNHEMQERQERANEMTRQLPDMDMGNDIGMPGAENSMPSRRRRDMNDMERNLI